MDKKSINTILTVGVIAVVGYFLFGKKLFGKSAPKPTATPSEDGGEEDDGNDSFSANGEDGQSFPTTIEDESRDIENIGNHKYSKKMKPRSFKDRCINMVMKKLRVQRAEAIKLLKSKNPAAMEIIEPLRQAEMKTRIRKVRSMNNNSAVSNMQSTEEGNFAFNDSEEID
jgi:hypothetical protein